MSPEVQSTVVFDLAMVVVGILSALVVCGGFTATYVKYQAQRRALLQELKSMPQVPKVMDDITMAKILAENILQADSREAMQAVLADETKRHAAWIHANDDALVLYQTPEFSDRVFPWQGWIATWIFFDLVAVGTYLLQCWPWK